MRRMARVGKTDDKRNLTPGTNAPWAKPVDKGDPPAGLEPDATTRRVYQASNMGLCVSALAAMAAGYTPNAMPDSLRTALDAGTRNEPVILEMVRQQEGLRSTTYPEMAHLKEVGVIAGYNPEMQQVQVRLDVGKGAVVRCHLDDVMCSVADPVWTDEGMAALVGVEAKAFGDALWGDWAKNQWAKGCGKYAWQVTAQRLSLGLPILFVVGHKDKDMGDLVTEIVTELVDDPPVPAGTFKMKVLKADRFARDDQIPDCDAVQWPCPFFDMPFHPDKAEAEVVEDEGLYVLCVELADRGATRTDANNRYDETKKELDKYLANAGIERGKKMVVKSERGRVEFEWVVDEVAEHTRKASTRSFPKVKVL